MLNYWRRCNSRGVSAARLAGLPWLAFVLWVGGGLPGQAQPAAAGVPRIASAPPEPQVFTPVDFFRQLLAAPPAERTRILAERPEGKRRYLLAKIEEFERLPAAEREQRLHLLQLRWFLVPLMRLPPDERAAQISRVPGPYQKWIFLRLQPWDSLGKNQQKEILENDVAIDYFVRAGVQPPVPGVVPRLGESAEKTAAEESREKPFKYIQRFFDLNEKEKSRTLAALSEADRENVDKILPEFDKLDPGQRRFCLDSFRRFMEMTPAEREQFKQRAQRWLEMSEHERNTWRQLVERVPPLPPGALQPPLPPPSLHASNSPGVDEKAAAGGGRF